MLTLVSANPAKYEPFTRVLERLRIGVEPPPGTLPEIQVLDFKASLEAKARAAAEIFGRPVLVDDAGLVLEAWRPFPGPLTSCVLRGLGVAGLRQLLNGVSDRAAMECHLGCWLGEGLRSWSGTANGRIDFSRQPRDERMLLTDLFVADAVGGGFLHRAAALAALEGDALDLHLSIPRVPPLEENACQSAPSPPCPFCIELKNGSKSIFADMMGGRLPSRVVYEDDYFVVMPPLGQFIEGGLLLLTREHLHSLADLPAERYVHLQRLVAAIQKALAQRWGVAPVFFEHGPAPERGKGVCCVDHAHLNIFPVAVPLHPHLTARMHMTIGSLAELSRLRQAEFGYLFVQENDGTRRVYDGEHVPTQLIRRIVTAAIGAPERWHWRDYPGYDELVTTFHALKGQITL